MKKSYWMSGMVIILLLFLLLVFLRGNEDSWIKDSRGVWIKHGNPSQMPDYVQTQQNIISCALNLYNIQNETMVFSSQCLGTCENYAVDIVHVPRTDEDNQPENQCEDYRSGKVNHFIELDKEGDIVTTK
jgi:hypothetical protein